MYAVAIFTGAALLFAVEPMFGKMVLPLLGGTSAVWITCMCFFQTMLLAGYAYAHLTTTWLGVRRQAVLHVAVLSVALAVQPIAVRQFTSPPTGTTPVFWLLVVLAVSVGGPFFAISATSPLLQKWFAHTPHSAAADPYFLYAASNLGSMLALVAYPILVEPVFRLGQQSRLWTCGYALLLVLVFTCAVFLWRSRAREPSRAQREPTGLPGHKSRRQERPYKLTVRRRLLWVLLALVPSSWMLGVTDYLTTDIAPMPLLWVLPLAAYLLTFILAFSRKPLVPRAVPVRLFPHAVLVLAVSLVFQGTWQLFLLHLIVFFLGAWTLHAALAQDRPTPLDLTEFYLWIAAGGLLGGVFNALVAPLVFPWRLEYAMAILLACLLYPAVLRAHKMNRADRRITVALLATVALLIALFAETMQFRGTTTLATLVLCGTPVLILVQLVGAHRWFAVGVGLLLVAGQLEPPVAGRVLWTERSFFGVHRVVVDPEGKYRRLLHGRTIHGMQSLDPARQCEPLAYYYRTGPLGQVFDVFSGPSAKRRVAVVGLGVGTMICYRRPGQEFTFYEIDPTVRWIAEGSGLFSYLSGCGAGGYRIVLGDGRLKLAEAPEGSYGMIIFDAFNSDAIPTHLLTRQALAVYLEKLAEDGILVFHISNRHLDLEPVLANLAADAGLAGRISRDDYVDDAERSQGKFASTYVVLARRSRHLKGLARLPQWKELTPADPGAVWTDDFSNITRIIKWW